MTLDELRASGRATCTVAEAGALLSIGRRQAYAACAEWIASGGRHGIPCLRIGSRVLVLVPRLLALLGDDLGAANDTALAGEDGGHAANLRVVGPGGPSP